MTLNSFDFVKHSLDLSFKHISLENDDKNQSNAYFHDNLATYDLYCATYGYCHIETVVCMNYYVE